MVPSKASRHLKPPSCGDRHHLQSGRDYIGLYIPCTCHHPVWVSNGDPGWQCRVVQPRHPDYRLNKHEWHLPILLSMHHILLSNTGSSPPAPPAPTQPGLDVLQLREPILERRPHTSQKETKREVEQPVVRAPSHDVPLVPRVRTFWSLNLWEGGGPSEEPITASTTGRACACACDMARCCKK